MLCLLPLPFWKPVLQQTKIIPQVILASDFAMFFVKQNAQSQIASVVLRGKQVMALKSGDLLLVHWESHCSEKKTQIAWPQKWRFGQKNVQLHVSCPWAVVQGRMAAVLLPEGWRKHKAPGTLIAAFPTCLASTWVGVNKDLLKEYKQGPPGAITLNLPFQVLSINTGPQSNPAGTL